MAKKTAPAFRLSSEGLKYMGTITCECTGEWSGHVKCWTEIGNPNGNQYSCGRTKTGKYYFVLEAVN